MKVIISSLFFLTGLIWGGGNSISFTLSLTQTKFLMDTPIQVSYTISNNSSQAVPLNCEYIIEKIAVLDQSGREYLPKDINSYARSPDTLNPGESCAGIFELNIFSSTREIEGGQFKGLKSLGYLPPGKYSVWVRGRSSGETLSNIITVAIKEPQGIDKEAFESFTQAKRILYERGADGKPKFSACYTALLSTAENYPNSIYGQSAFNRALNIYRIVHSKDVRGQIDLAKKLISKYPNSSYLSSWFGYMFRGYREVKDRITLHRTLKEYRDSYPNTKIPEVADKFLRSLEEMEF